MVIRPELGRGRRRGQPGPGVGTCTTSYVAAGFGTSCVTKFRHGGRIRRGRSGGGAFLSLGEVSTGWGC